MFSLLGLCPGAEVTVSLDKEDAPSLALKQLILSADGKKVGRVSLCKQTCVFSGLMLFLASDGMLLCEASKGMLVYERAHYVDCDDLHTCLCHSNAAAQAEVCA